MMRIEGKCGRSSGGLKRSAVAVLAFCLPLAFSACGDSGSDPEADSKNVIPIAEKPLAENQSDVKASDGEQCRICDFDQDSYKGDLSKKEVEGLLLALNDEYRAWATYDRINRDFSDPRPFVNIQKAEGRHIERLTELFRAHNLRVPENKWMGNVTRYQSLEEACRAGVEGEIANRELYTQLFESTEREDIITVFKALQSASEENHLPAFQRCIESGGRARVSGN